MSNFQCEKCGTVCYDTPNGYITGCEHYPADLKYVDVPKIDNDHQDCQDCKHCVVLEDRLEGRIPFASCAKDHEIVELDICDFAPKEYCKDFEAGGASYY